MISLMIHTTHTLTIIRLRFCLTVAESTKAQIIPPKDLWPSYGIDIITTHVRLSSCARARATPAMNNIRQ